MSNKTIVPVECSGDLQITTCVGSKSYEINVNNVLYVANLTSNLLSMSRIITSSNRVKFDQHGCSIYNSQNDCIGVAKLENGVYRLNVKTELMFAASVMVSSTTWHRGLAHINGTDLQRLKNGVIVGVNYNDKCDISKNSCTVCCEGKQTILPFLHSVNKSIGILELVHTDLCGPMKNLSLGKARYFLLFVDDFSRMCIVYFL